MRLDPPDVIDGIAQPRELQATVIGQQVDDIMRRLVGSPELPRDRGREWYRQVYLQSDEWRALRSLAIETASRRCADCGIRDETKSLDVHHLTYERLGDELLKDLIVVCRGCHSARHGDAT